eukprot:TRINITY_DN250_c1_g2_i1.p1 TRINITY_DN250_c1_g2~~TRINITY_DN250_c1_g2_i1.p1  ORF type:complete len:289 (+),score=64.06 TRINITY_DN250_c1_g2_i1:168-1034(+)
MEYVVGREGGRRQRFFRSAKGKVKELYIRAIPTETGPLYWKNLVKSAWAEFIAMVVFVFFSAGVAISAKKSTADVDTREFLVDAGFLLVGSLGGAISLSLAMANALPTSGGHVNPAVTLAFVATGRLDGLAGLVYLGAQFLGAFLGGFLVLNIWGDVYGMGATTFGTGTSVPLGIVAELILTFALVFTVWATAVDPKGNKTLAPLAVGLTLFAAGLLGGPISGPSLNPARTFGTAIWSGNFDNFWVYLIFPLISGLVSGLLYEYLFIRTTDESELHYEELVIDASPSE